MAKEKTAQELPGSDTPFGPLSELQKTGYGNIMGANAAWFENFGDIGAEVFSFLADRIREDVKTQHEIMHCKDVAKIQEIQGRFVQKAIDQYQAETGKLAQMGMSAFGSNHQTP